MGFGERLQREREMRGITLEEIANATKIGTRSLRALEEEDFDKLPGGIFNKGFVRAYARYLGLDQEQAVADYMTVTGEPQRKDDVLDGEHLKKIEENWKPAKPRTIDPSWRIPWVPLVILLLLAAAGAAGWRFRHQLADRLYELRFHQKREQPAEVLKQTSAAAYQAPIVTTTEPVPSPAQVVVPPVAVEPQAAAPPVAPPADPEFVIQVRAKEDSWVSIAADGKPVLKGMLKAARVEEIRAKHKVSVTAGNAAGVDVSFNGKPQPSLGAAKQVRTVIFTPDGMQSLPAVQ